MKVHVVFDASPHEKGEPSFTDVLDQGVNLGPELLQLLLQFKCYPHRLEQQVCHRDSQNSVAQYPSNFASLMRTA